MARPSPWSARAARNAWMPGVGEWITMQDDWRPVAAGPQPSRGADGHSAFGSISFLFIHDVDERLPVYEPLDILLNNANHSLIIAIRSTRDVRRYHNVVEFPSVSYTHLRAHETRHDLVCR